MLGTWGITIDSTDLADPGTAVVVPEGTDGGPNVVEYLLAAGLGASGPLFQNLGNAKIVSKWTITQPWSTDTLANNYYLTAQGAYGGVHTVTLSHVDYSGATSNWVITGAKVQLAVARPIGVTTITTLTLTGPAPVLQP